MLPLPIPASIYGLGLLFVLLRVKVLKVESIREVANFLIAIMPLMFIAPGVGLLKYADMLKSFWLPLIVIALATTVFVMAVTGGISQWIMNRQEKRS